MELDESLNKASSPQGGDCKFLRNVIINLQVHTALQTRRPTSTRIELLSLCTPVASLFSNCNRIHLSVFSHLE
jgi:hypothetical protein